MSQNNNKSINPLMLALAGIAVGAAAAYLMKKNNREKVIKKYKQLKKDTETLLDDTTKTVEKTKKDLKKWAEDIGEKAEEQAQKIDSQARKRRVLNA